MREGLKLVFLLTPSQLSLGEGGDVEVVEYGAVESSPGLLSYYPQFPQFGQFRYSTGTYSLVFSQIALCTARDTPVWWVLHYYTL